MFCPRVVTPLREPLGLHLAASARAIRHVSTRHVTAVFTTLFANQNKHWLDSRGILAMHIYA